MSKPNSGHFKKTSGIRKASIKKAGIRDIIAERTQGLDLREHPSKYKQLCNKKRKELQQKFKQRTLTKNEYKRLIWNKKINARRRAGVMDFWDQERYRSKHGMPTRNWNGKQISDILNCKRPKFHGKTMESHHVYSVVKYPHLANLGEVIYPATHLEHFKGWHGGNYRKSKSGKQIVHIREF